MNEKDYNRSNQMEKINDHIAIVNKFNDFFFNIESHLSTAPKNETYRKYPNNSISRSFHYTLIEENIATKSLHPYKQRISMWMKSLTVLWLALLKPLTWQRHQMETSSALLAFCAGNSPVTGEFPAQRPVTRSFDFFLSALELTVEQTMETPVIWNAIALIITSLWWITHSSHGYSMTKANYQ